MSNNSPRYEAASAEDYFSDNTQGRDQVEFLRRAGTKLEAITSRCNRPKFAKRTSSFGQRLVQHAIKKLSESEFNARLDKINIPRPSDPVDMLPVLRDGVFSYISELLRQFGQGEWALRPRTFCILRILGCPEAMDTFIKLKRTDAFLPYNDRNLPDAIKGAELRERFLRLQTLVLSSQHLKDLEQEGGAHFHFHALADDCFSPLRTLGSGGAGIVDEVYGSFSLKYFARKRIHRGMSVLKDQDALDSFEKELRALKAASHRHLVKLVSSYSDPIYVGLIMRPVADQDLKAYLLNSWSTDVDRKAQRQCLRTFFGCLIKALEYLHQHGIIHKDIKPQNILVKKEDVYFTDFGTAKTIGDASRSFSTGITGKITERYCAPEVIDQAPRGRPSDIWSMGCVFLEMATVLLGRSLNDLEAYYATHGTTSRYFYKNEEATEGWIDDLGSIAHPDDREVLEWTRSMLVESQKDRPTASQIVAKIADTPSEHRYFCFNCLEDDPINDGGHRQPYHPSTSDIVNGATLQSYVRRDSIHDSDEDDTVTSKILEEKGMVSVATECDVSDDATQVEQPMAASGESGTIRDAQKLTEEVEGVPVPTPTAAELPVVQDQGCDTTVAKEATSLPAGSITPLRSSLKAAGTPATEKEVRFRPNTDFRFEFRTSSKRFSGLTADRRPLPAEPLEDTVDIEEMPIVAPEPLRPPPLGAGIYYPPPKATLVPSYILAGSNRFSMKEVRASDATMGTHNLFVYGRLMFPSALRAFAARSTQGQGVYSSMHQRRLVPTSSDWANVDVSIKNAAGAMTPARLRDYDAWRPSGMNCAAIQEVSWTEKILARRNERGLPALETAAPGEVVGFLVLGVSEEVLRYCDSVFTSDSKSLKRAQKIPEDNGDDQRIGGLLERKRVTVDVLLTSGEYRSLPANTYVWSQGVDHLRHPWRPESLVRSAHFQDLCHLDQGDWRAEESALAETMKIAYALAGDELCSAVISDDLPKLKDLLDDYENVDARCRKYGTPLQAAVATGSLEMVELLLEHGANPSSRGGKYGSPLIAATVGKRRTIARTLLEHRADIFAGHPQYVNALYQAVGATDYALAEMLLEGGAWLSQDFREIRDLAYEKRDRELQDLLLQYDVRAAYADGLEERQTDRRVEDRRGEDVGFLRKYGPVTKAVLRKLVVVSGQSGSLRGRKGVAITKAALAAGAPLTILDTIRNAVDPVMKLIDMLKASDQRQELKSRAEKASIGRVEELPSDEEDSGDDSEGRSPTSPLFGHGDLGGRSTLNVAPPPLSRGSSASSASSSRSYGSHEPRDHKQFVQFEGGKYNASFVFDSIPRHRRDPLPGERQRRRYAQTFDRENKSPSGGTSPSLRPRSPEKDEGREHRRSVPRIISPSSNRSPSRNLVTTGKTLASVDQTRTPSETSSRNSQFLYPPPSRRQRARSLEDNRYEPAPPVTQQFQTQASSSCSSPTGSPTTQRRDQKAHRRSGQAHRKRSEYHEGSRPRSSSDVTGQSSCERCGGIGYYREILRGRTGPDVVREVDCKDCKERKVRS